MSSKKMTRYYIPHPQDLGCNIAGDLEQVESELPTHGRKVALVCRLFFSATLPHASNSPWIRYYMALWGKRSLPIFGAFFDKARVDSHKDYLFQKRLAKLLSMDSFRFDFRWVWKLILVSLVYEPLDFSVGITRHLEAGTWRHLRTTYKTSALWSHF